MITSSQNELLKQSYYSASGTVLKRKEGLKSGQSLLLFLKGFGAVWVSAPAASSKNRFGGATEPLVWSVFNLYKSPTRFYLKSAEVKEDFLSVRNNPRKLLTAFEFYKLLSKVLYNDHENDNILKLLWSSMVLISHDLPCEAVRFRFIWRLLKNLGLAPSLTHCVNCGSQIETHAVAATDGLLCPNCAKGGNEITKEQLKNLQTAALLPQEQFEEAAAYLKDTAFAKESEYLMSFFAMNR